MCFIPLYKNFFLRGGGFFLGVGIFFLNLILMDLIRIIGPFPKSETRSESM